MSKFTIRVAVPIVLVGIFAMVAFTALDYEQLPPDFYIFILFLTIYVFFFGLAIGQSLSSPIKKILDGATKLSKGNLSSRVYLETKDELSELAKTFNKIAEKLEVSHLQEENIEKSVGIKVKARTKDLEEIIDALEQKIKNRTIELERLTEELNKLQGAVKNKESETDQLKKELNNFKQKVNKYNKPKQEVIDKNNP
jgi:methyl-accepting chemotaxis protein